MSTCICGNCGHNPHECDCATEEVHVVELSKQGETSLICPRPGCGGQVIQGRVCNKCGTVYPADDFILESVGRRN